MKRYLPFILFIIGFSGCKEDVALRDWIKKVDELRIKALEAMPQTPYQSEQHHAFRNYFGQIEQVTVQLVQSKDYKAAFNRAIAKVDLKDACGRVFLGHQDWQAILDNCTKNGLFICSEEVRVYSDLVVEIRKQLVPEQQKRFDQTPECQGAL
ncbi:MAG: hypothetical protein HYV97_15775 [Bdellovibrio sp.]|nr:hypothetical protein [Bdellovibrio sp.]